MMLRMMHPDPLQWGFAHSPAEEATMRANGWVDDVPAEVVTPSAPVVVEDSGPDYSSMTKAEMIAALEARGVKVDKAKNKAALLEDLKA